jgi:hypothetical protein
MTETHGGKGDYEFDATGVSLEYFSEANRLDLYFDLPNSSDDTPSATEWLKDKGTLGNVISALGPPEIIQGMQGSPWKSWKAFNSTPVPITHIFYRNGHFLTIFVFKREVSDSMSFSDPLYAIILIPSNQMA